MKRGIYIVLIMLLAANLSVASETTSFAPAPVVINSDTEFQLRPKYEIPETVQTPQTDTQGEQEKQIQQSKTDVEQILPAIQVEAEQPKTEVMEDKKSEKEIPVKVENEQNQTVQEKSSIEEAVTNKEPEQKVEQSDTKPVETTQVESELNKVETKTEIEQEKSSNTSELEPAEVEEQFSEKAAVETTESDNDEITPDIAGEKVIKIKTSPIKIVPVKNTNEY